MLKFVYRITNYNEFTAQDVTMDINAIKKTVRSGAFRDPTGKSRNSSPVLPYLISSIINLL